MDRCRYIDELHYVIYSSKILKKFLLFFEKVSINRGHDSDILFENNSKGFLLN